MGLINIASGNSIWRGLDYYKANKVIECKKVTEYEYYGIVKGTRGEKYKVFMNIEHPRQSKCDCPHAKGKKIICKHIIALYFNAFPKEVDIFLKEVEESQKRCAAYEEELYNKTIRYINSMSKKELIDSLIEVLNIAPEWVYDRFVRDRIEY